MTVRAGDIFELLFEANGTNITISYKADNDIELNYGGVENADDANVDTKGEPYDRFKVVAASISLDECSAVDGVYEQVKAAVRAGLVGTATYQSISGEVLRMDKARFAGAQTRKMGSGTFSTMLKGKIIKKIS